MQTYQEMKDSGVAWLGDIPTDWQLKRVGVLFRQRSEKVSDKDYQPLSVTKNGIVPQLEGAAKSNDGDNRKLVLKGDFVINSRSDRKGSSGLSELDGSVSLINIVLADSKLYPRYAHNLLRSYSFQEEFYRWGQGIVADLWSTNYQRMKSIQLPVPNYEAQKQIANYLDKETAQIDELIAKQERLLALIEEKRQSTIDYAVKNGLNPKVPMIDSKISWLGRIPRHWSIKRLGYLGRCQNGINIGADQFGAGFPFVSYGDVYNNRVLHKKASGLVQSSSTDRISYSVERGDIFFTRTSETIEDIGLSSVCFETIKDAVFAGFLIRFRPLKECGLDINFAKYYFQSITLRAYFVKEMNLVTRASLSQGLLKRLPVVIPPLDEQIQIAKYLDEKDILFKSLSKKLRKQIGLLKERRVSLISHAVTGKIEV